MPSFVVNKLNEDQPQQIAAINRILSERDLAVYSVGAARSALRNGIDISMNLEEEKRLFGPTGLNKK